MQSSGPSFRLLVSQSKKSHIKAYFGHKCSEMCRQPLRIFLRCSKAEYHIEASVLRKICRCNLNLQNTQGDEQIFSAEQFKNKILQFGWIRFRNSTSMVTHPGRQKQIALWFSTAQDALFSHLTAEQSTGRHSERSAVPVSRVTVLFGHSMHLQNY